MRIHLHEINEQETELSFTQEDAWVGKAVMQVDEEPRREPRPVQVEFKLSQVDGVVVASGELDTQIRLLCSRCGKPHDRSVRPRFSALFCQDPVMAGISHLQEGGKPAGQNQGHARHAHDFESESNLEGGIDLDITYLSQDYIDLAEILTEQLRLQVPFQPLCKETCKGVCMNCGADLNTGRCACAKIVKPTPFAALKDFKPAGTNSPVEKA